MVLSTKISLVLVVFVLDLVIFTTAMPQDQNSEGAPPFLQFTNGGLRVNFAGYHAQAGLGGLLTGNAADGGLHASAGTPWGPSAAAGLGGLLGSSGTAGGGLYARAGLGNGRPEAGAGLGGVLDGSGRTAPAAGGLFAGATTGNWGGGNAAAGLSGNTAENGESKRASAAASASTKSGHTNIQVISRGKDKDADSNKVNISHSKQPYASDQAAKESEARRDVKNAVVAPVGAQAGLFGSLFASANLSPVPVGKVKIGTVDVVPLPPPPPPPVHRIAVSVPVVPVAPVASVEGGIVVNSIPQTVAVAGTATKAVENVPKDRGYVRKGFRGGIRKQVAYNAEAGAAADVAVVPVADASVPSYKVVSTGGTLFNDIFNIPISTLAAVNQFLNNLG